MSIATMDIVIVVMSIAIARTKIIAIAVKTMMTAARHAPTL